MYSKNILYISSTFKLSTISPRNHQGNLKVARTRRFVADRFRAGQGHHFCLSTLAINPTLELPVHPQRVIEALEEHLHETASDARVTDLDVTLYTSMNLTAHGSNDNLIMHANPCLAGAPWYDFVQILAADAHGRFNEEGEHVGTGGGFAFWSAKLVVFLSVHDKRSCHSEDAFLSLVHLHGVRNGRAVNRPQGKRLRNDRAPACEYIHDLENKAIHASPTIPFPVVQPCHFRDQKPMLWLVDTETISSGLWGQECFDVPGRVWLLRAPSKA